MTQSLAERFALAPLKWTKEPPTREGWYWLRANPARPSRIVHIALSGQKLSWYDYHSSDWVAVSGDHEWSGPIPEPQE